MAGMGKVKALQIWCKNRVNGYQNVEITNMTTSWRDGLAFCALIHRFRPDLIDFDSLSKENVYENNALAFEIAESLGIPALLEADDMVRLETPDKLSIITYVAQLHNYFKDKDPVGGPDVKMAAKRPSDANVQRSMSTRSPESKRKPTHVDTNKNDQKDTALADVCQICDGKVYIIEKHIQDGKVYHRSCFKRNSRKTDTSAYITPPSLPTKASPKSRVAPTPKRYGTQISEPAKSTTDTEPGWQKKVQSKTSVAKRLSGFLSEQIAESKQLEPVSENGAGPKTSTPVTNEAETVKMRSRPPITGTNKALSTRAVSSGVTMEEKIAKLREIRSHAKTREGSPSIKARLEKLQSSLSKDSPPLQQRSSFKVRESKTSPTPMDMTDSLSSSSSVSEENLSKQESKIDNISVESNSTEPSVESNNAEPSAEPSTIELSADSSTIELSADSRVAEPPIEFTPTENSTVVVEPGANDPVNGFPDMAGSEPTNNKAKTTQAAETVPDDSTQVLPESLSERITDESEPKLSEDLSNPFEDDEGKPNKVEDSYEQVSVSYKQDEVNSENYSNEDVSTKQTVKMSKEDNLKDSQSEKDMEITVGNLEKEVVNIHEKMDESSSTSQVTVAQETPPTLQQNPPTLQQNPPTLQQTVIDEDNKSLVNSTITVQIKEKSPAPVRPKRASSIRTIKKSTNTENKPNNSNVSEADVVSPPRRLSSVSITVSSSPSNSRRSSIASINSQSQHSGSVNSESQAQPDSSTNPFINEDSNVESGEDNAGSKSPKPPRPSNSPAVKQTKSSADTKTAPSRPAQPPVSLRHKNEKKAPTRPKTVASGTASTSQFYVDESHQRIREPPPKPARQSVIQQAGKTISKAKESWEGALENWSNKRNEHNRSTWYSTQDYPSECNPFGDEEEDDSQNSETKPNQNQNNVNISDKNSQPSANSSYDDSLNPFACDDEVEADNSNAQSSKKVIHANPFEVSDDENDIKVEVEASTKKKLIPDDECQVLPVTKDKVKQHGISELPKSSSTRRKKQAPAPPPPVNQNSPHEQNHLTPPLTQKSSSSLQDLNSTTPQNTTESQNDGSTTPEIGKKKHRPAPPRPMPPKRRVVSEYGITSDDIQLKLNEIEDKQHELEEKGRQLEKAIRNADENMGTESRIDEDELLSNWLETINEKNQLVRQESELVFIVKHQQLEEEQADIEWELRMIMHQAENLKTDSDKAREEELLQKLVTVVHERSQLVDKMDEERLRQQEEDQEINSVLRSKLGHLEVTPNSNKKSKKHDKDKKNKKAKKSKS